MARTVFQLLPYCFHTRCKKHTTTWLRKFAVHCQKLKDSSSKSQSGSYASNHEPLCEHSSNSPSGSYASNHEQLSERSSKSQSSSYASNHEPLSERKKLHKLLNKRGEKFLNDLYGEKQKEKEELEYLIETLRAETNAQVPEQLSPNDMKILLNSPWDLNKKLLYLKKCYLHEQEQKQKQRELEEAISRVEGLYDDDLNPVVRPGRQRRFMNRWKSLQAAQFGWPVVVDMDYDLHEAEALQTIKQIQLLYKNNCEHLQPCWLHFTSFPKNMFIDDLLKSKNGKNILADFHSEHFLELFPKKRLFYLVAEGPTIDQEELDPDLIFVIGGLSGISLRNRSFQKARHLGIPCGSFPLEKFVSLKVTSSRDLYLQHVIEILLDKMLCRTWKEALDARLPDNKYQKYPNIQGPLPGKGTIKSRRQFEKLEKALKFLKKDMVD